MQFVLEPRVLTSLLFLCSRVRRLQITSVCGAALWAAELEVRGLRPAGGIEQQQQLQAAPMRQGEMQALAMGGAPMIVQQPMMPVPAAAQLAQPQVVEAHVVASAPPPTQIFEKEAPAGQTVSVVVPAGLQPGQAFSFQDPQGRTMQMTVPQNVYGGQTIQVQV